MIMQREDLIERLRIFAEERDWNVFHTPRNIACALSVEASELLEIFQWSRGEGWSELSEEKVRTKVEDELADIYLYLLRFADLAKIDLDAVAERKIVKNAVKYPVNLAKGTDKKYNELGE